MTTWAPVRNAGAKYGASCRWNRPCRPTRPFSSLVTARRRYSKRYRLPKMSKHRTTLIFKTVVDAGDSAAISRLLELIPDSAKLYPRIRSRFTETCYDPETRREFWIGGDDRHIICFMITGIGS